MHDTARRWASSRALPILPAPRPASRPRFIGSWYLLLATAAGIRHDLHSDFLRRFGLGGFHFGQQSRSNFPMPSGMRDRRDSFLVALRQRTKDFRPPARAEFQSLPDSKIEHAALCAHLAQKSQPGHDFVISARSGRFRSGRRYPCFFASFSSPAASHFSVVSRHW